MSNKSKTIQRSIQVYAISAVILSIIMVAAVSIIPLYKEQRETEKQGLRFARDTSVLIVDEYIARIKDIAKQISSRTKARMLLHDWIKGLSRKENEEFLRKILNDALKVSPQLRGITRIDTKGVSVASVGKYIDKLFFPKTFAFQNIKIIGPYLLNNHYFITVLSPVFSKNNIVIGTDVCLFKVDDLQFEIHKKLHKRLGEVLVAYLENDSIEIFSPIDASWKSSLSSNLPLIKTLTQAIERKEVGLISDSIGGENFFIAYSPLHEAPKWGVSVIVQKSVLYKSLRNNLKSILSAIALLAIFFTLGLGVVLRPLSGKIILETKELEKKIERSKQSLQKANKELEHSALYDYLTNVLNRRGFEKTFLKELSRANRTQVPFSLFCLDVDNFKDINDERGHKAGDEVLKHLANKLCQALRKEDAIGRFGGDEFVLLTPNIGKKEADSVYEKIKSLNSIPLIFNGERIYYSISLGGTTYEGTEESLDDLLKRADKNMYEDKGKKKNS